MFVFQVQGKCRNKHNINLSVYIIKVLNLRFSREYWEINF